MEILYKFLDKNALIVAFVTVGGIMYLGELISTYVLRKKIPGSAVAIFLGLVFAYVAGSAVYSKYLFFPHIPGAGELLVFCAAMAGAGLALIGSAHGQAMPLLGFLLTVAAAFAWASGNVVSRFVARHGPMNQFAFVVWAGLVPPVPFVLLSLWLEGPQAIATALQGLGWSALGAVAYLAWAATLLGYGLWTWLMARHPANLVAPFSLLVPVVGLSTGWLLFDEQLLPVHFAGGALLMAGLLFNLFGERLLRRRPTAGGTQNSP